MQRGTLAYFVRIIRCRSLVFIIHLIKYHHKTTQGKNASLFAWHKISVFLVSQLLLEDSFSIFETMKITIAKITINITMQY